MGAPLTGWMYTDARQQVPCARCGAEPGQPCRQPAGRKAAVPHGERLRALLARFPADTWRRPRRPGAPA